MSWFGSNWSASNWTRSYWFGGEFDGSVFVVISSAISVTGRTYSPFFQQSGIAAFTSYATAVTYTPTVHVHQYVTTIASNATAFTYSPSVVVEANKYISALVSRATGFTYDPFVDIPTQLSASLSRASARTLAGTLFTSATISISGGTSSATGYTYSPVWSATRIYPSVISITGVTFGPTVKIITHPSAITASGTTYDPTLQIGSTIFVGAIVVTGRTPRARFSNGLGGLPDQFTTTEILDSYPALRKGILTSAGQNVNVVLAGQIGLSAGDVLIYLGNGQWKRR